MDWDYIGYALLQYSTGIALVTLALIVVTVFTAHPFISELMKLSIWIIGGIVGSTVMLVYRYSSTDMKIREEIPSILLPLVLSALLSFIGILIAVVLGEISMRILGGNEE